MNVLKTHRRNDVETLLRAGFSQREIERRLKVNRRTIRKIAAKCSGVATGSGKGPEQTAPPQPPATQSASTCEPYRAFIEAQVELGRNAVSIHQDLVELHGFDRYSAVKRFARRLKAKDPDRFDVLEFLPGEECQVDYGQGALTRHPKSGKYKRPYLFVMVLKYSGKAFRKTEWKTSQEIWTRLHEEAWRSFGGCCANCVLDNLKEGVITPSIYEPRLNPVYAAMLKHHGVVADPCRVRDPNRKGTVENAIQHTQDTALKGRRFEAIEDQNVWLAHWEDRWAAPRIHGRKKRQVLEMFNEERPHLKALNPQPFQFFREVERTVDDAGMVHEGCSYYSALPARIYSKVKVRIYERHIEILADDGAVLRCHEKAARKGTFVMDKDDRLFNPSRETGQLLAKLAKVGPYAAKLGEALFAKLGRPGKKALYGLVNLLKTYQREDIEAVSEAALAGDCVSYQTIKRALEHRAAAPAPKTPTQSAPEIREISEYQEFFDTHSHTEEDEAA